MSAPNLAMSVRKAPSRVTRSGAAAGSLSGRPSTRTRCRPTRKEGRRLASATASCAAAAPTIRLAAVSTPSVCARSIASFTAPAAPKSSAVITSCLTRSSSGRGGLPAFTKEGKELHAFAQAPLHHVEIAQHLRDDRADLAGPEVEPAVEGLHRLEDLLVAEVRVVKRRYLEAVAVHQLGVRRVEPAVLHRLVIEEGPVVEEELLGLREPSPGVGDLRHHALHRPRPVVVSAHRLRP